MTAPIKKGGAYHVLLSTLNIVLKFLPYRVRLFSLTLTSDWLKHAKSTTQLQDTVLAADHRLEIDIVGSTVSLIFYVRVQAT